MTLRPIELGWAKLVSRCWEVTEASDLLYFKNKKWTRKAVAAEVEESNNKIVFAIKNGGFAVVERFAKGGN